MKKLFLFLSLALVACSSDDRIAEPVQITGNKVLYTINGETHELTHMYMNDITSGGDAIGKHIGAYADAESGYYKVNFNFYNNAEVPGGLELYQVEVLVWYPPVNGVNTGSYYSNYIPEGNLPFEHTVRYEDGKVAGLFSGALTDLNDTLTVDGSIEFVVPLEE